MKKTLSIFLITLVAAFFAACPAGNETGNSNTNAAAPEKTLEATLAALDKSAGEAYAKKDGKYFETFLANDFVGHGGNGRVDKAMIVKFISEDKCEIKSTLTTDGKITKIADGVALQTGKGSSDGTCDGKETPDSYFATLYVKDGDTWKAAFHQSNSIAPAADAAKSEDGADAKKEEKPAADAAKPEDGADEAPMTPKVANDEAIAKALTAVENGLWEAWIKQDTKAFDDSLAANFVEITATGTIDRATAIKEIAENKCEITSTDLSDGMATKVTDNVYVFTYQGKAAGKCDGNTLPDVPMHTTTIFMKDGDKWRPVFHMQSPDGS